ncbi:MAG: trehalose-phosphatase [Bacteroidetes bacterium]|jgi:trehalose 6-phosphate phosphatase|nr:trehalose-phosphatase [Bacteroidota bacterium]
MPDSPPPVAPRPLFFLDYDGTLAPIVDEPSEAFPHPEAPTLLQQLEARYPVWIVTGRHLRDLGPFLPDLNLQAIGLHGAQDGTVGGTAQSRLTEDMVAALRQMRETVPDLDGVWVEDKEHTFAVHYRQAADKQRVRERLRDWVVEAPDVLDAIWGKDVVELRPDGLDKGAAVTEIAREHPDRTPVYLGDDVTDEDAFRALAAMDDDAVTVKVGDGETRARYRLTGPDAVVAYLRQYLE